MALAALVDHLAVLELLAPCRVLMALADLARVLEPRLWQLSLRGKMQALMGHLMTLRQLELRARRVLAAGVPQPPRRMSGCGNRATHTSPGGGPHQAQPTVRRHRPPRVQARLETLAGGGPRQASPQQLMVPIAIAQLGH